MAADARPLGGSLHNLRVNTAMKTFRKDVVEKAKAYWFNSTRAGFLSFLASKYAGLGQDNLQPIDADKDFEFIQRFLKEADGSYTNPCPYSEKQKHPYPGTYDIAGIINGQRINPSLVCSRAYDVSGEPRRQKHYKFSDDYINVIRGHAARGHKLLLPYVVIWLYRNEKFGSNKGLKAVTDKFVSDFHITQQELHELFTDSESELKKLFKFTRRTVRVAPKADTAIAIEENFVEGEKRAIQTTARNAKLRVAAKKQWGLRCYCCGFDFGQFYGTIAQDFAIIHHLEDFRSSTGKRSTKVEEVRVVCANCHYVIHLSNPPLDVDKLRKKLLKSWLSWSKSGVKRKPKIKTA